MTDDQPDCECFTNPMESPCCNWENEHLCVCADYGLIAEGDRPAPS